ncbi:CBS domain-containing protein [Amycolatopsis sp. FDAARGOS 1241]|uniref:CBS domain-containing protein n=1 Tax=Amycolatopsis sp. FDAARGOS 1241 TaxID=2778070 RepID=UPI00194F8A82|nr:CBS domain-containing protein [Amycolatopsis sp. FDAARGOS 1241]QRP42902.1 CBS domain-containing protein [Amycolatopsis sp. FDAARGOS 1241]
MTGQHPVSAVMTTDVASVPLGTPFKAVTALLEERGVGGTPVVDDRGHVAGVISRADLLEREVEHRGFGPRARRARRKAEAVFAADLMSSPAVTIRADDDVVRAAQLMESHGVHRLPVVDADGALAGIVSRADLVRVFLRPDKDIYDEVRDEVLTEEMCIDPQSLYVAVHDGIVSISGTVERYSMIGLIEALVRRVDGVVEVRSHLKAHLDDRDLRPDEPPAGGRFGRRSIHRP